MKKKHHYLSKFYLEGFCDSKGMVWTYEKCKPNNTFPTKPLNTANENGLYHIESENDVNFVENLLANLIETKAANALKVLRNKQFPINEDRKQLAMFFGTLMVRTPGYLAHLQSQHDKFLNLFLKASASDKDGFYNGYKNAGIVCNEKEVEEDRVAILNNEIKVILHRNYLLQIMIILGTKVAEQLYNLNWVLIETNEEYPFITSDMILNAPIDSYYSPGLGMAGSVIYIPISKYLTLLMLDEKSNLDKRIFTLDDPKYTSKREKVDLKTLIKSLNRMTFIQSNKYIFANTNSKKLKKMFENLLTHAKLFC